MLNWLLTPVGLLSGMNNAELMLSQKSRVSGGGGGVGVGGSAAWLTKGRKTRMSSLSAATLVGGIGVVAALIGISASVDDAVGVRGGESE